jgi:hypothetical protein
MSPAHDPNQTGSPRPAHPMGASVLLVIAVVGLITLLAVASSLR